MEKVSHFYLRSVFSRFLCLLIVFSIILLNTSIVSNASGVAGSTTSVSITYNNSEDSLRFGNTYLPWNWNSETDHFEVNLDDTSVFWYKGKQVLLFTSSQDYYGYYVQVTRTSNTTNTSEYAQQKFWCIGTAGQLMQGENRGGTITSSSFTAWVPTNNSVQAVHMAPFYQFFYEYDLAYNNDSHYPAVIAGSYSINAKYTVKYTGYKTKSEYDSAMNDIKTELEEQTGIQNDQLTELEEQTGIQNDQLTELEEQTATQKNMFTKITDFFGSFFENLKNSVIGLFVPSKEDMKALFDRMMDFFNEKFGFLAFPFDFFLSVVNLFLDNDAGTTEIVLPAFSIMGYQVWPYITFDLTDYDIIAELFGYVRLLNGVLISTGFINYLRSRYEKIMRR